MKRTFLRIFAQLLAFLLMLPLAGCGAAADSASASPQSAAAAADTSAAASAPAAAGAPLVFSRDGTIEQTVLWDQDGVRITAEELTYGENSAELALLIENSSAKDVSVISGSLGYSCNSVNGIMADDCYLNCSVAAGKKANDSITFDYRSLMVYGIDEIADLELGFDIGSGTAADDLYTGPIPLQTSLAAAHDYSTDVYQTAIASAAAMQAYGYALPVFEQKEVYAQNGVRVISEGLTERTDGSCALLLEAVNESQQQVVLSTQDITVNGLLLSAGTWSSRWVNPGKTGVLYVQLTDVLDESHWDACGIGTIGTAGLTLVQRSADFDTVGEPAPITLAVPGVQPAFDRTGTELYNANGLRIVSKGILAHNPDLSGDVDVLLLAENTSGGTLSVSDVYGSAAVNGFMTDAWFLGADIPDGGCALLTLQLMDTSLSDNGITDLSQITEASVSVEISKGYDTIDTPALTITA